MDAADFEFTYYLVLIRNRIATNWAPPAGLSSGGQPMRAVVYFRIQPRRRGLGARGSRRERLVEFFDRSALRAVQLSDPMPPLPLGYAGGDLGIHFGFEYDGAMTRALTACVLGVLAVRRRRRSAERRAHRHHLGQDARIRIHCEAMDAQGSRNAAVSSVQADELLANDLDRSAVFAVSRAWVDRVSTPFDVAGLRRRQVGGVGKPDQAHRRGARLPGAANRSSCASTAGRQRVARRSSTASRTTSCSSSPASWECRRRASRSSRPPVATKELCVVDFDGQGFATLTRDQSIAQSPAWSPDGSLILFTSYRGGTGPQICVTPAAGGKDIPRLRSPGQQHQRVVLARRPRGRVHAQPGRELGDLPARRARRVAAPPHQSACDRYLAGMVADRSRDRVHVRPRRVAAGLRHGPRRW